MKVLDSYLLQLPEDGAAARFDILESVIPMFFRLCDYLQVASRRFLYQAASSQDKSPELKHEAVQVPDILLPRVSEALILTVQCLCTVTLAEEHIPKIDPVHSAKLVVSEACSSENTNFIQSLIGIFFYAIYLYAN